MLRIGASTARCISGRAARQKFHSQWLPNSSQRLSIVDRGYAVDSKQNGTSKPSIKDSKAAVLPGSNSSATNQPLPPGAVDLAPGSSPSPANPSSSVPPKNVPLVPTPPKTPIASSSSISSSPPPPPPSTPASIPKPRRSRFRAYLITLLLLSLSGFGGGVYYSLNNDAFHDFFTEYIPFGEEAVLYFEEREFRRRFPAAAERALGPARDTGKRVTIPSKSGVSWNVQEKGKEGDDGSKGASLSERARTKVEEVKEIASEKSGKAQAAVTGSAQTAVSKTKSEASAGVQKAASKLPEVKSKPAQDSKAAVSKTSSASDNDAKKAKDASAAPSRPPGKFPPITHIDPLSIKNADEPLVQDLVGVLNNVITVINADSNPSKYASTIAAAKSQVASIGQRILDIRKSADISADAKVAASHSEFDAAAKELIARLEGEMHQQESQWKDELNEELKHLSANYDARLKTELAQARDVADKKLKNSLSEQAQKLKNEFSTSVQQKVETERNSRLGKLTELASSVNDLESLTAAWKSVLDANLRTQHLHVAVEAVRTSLDKADRPTPFVRELAALKEIASDDAVVNAAIASINPSSYQKGLLTSAQLIDRFRRVATEVRKAGLLDEDSGVASHAASLLLSKVMFKKVGTPEGQDVESVLSRTETLLEEGDLDGATREMNALKGWAKTLSKDWLGEARKVLEVRQALDVIATQARLESLRVDQ